MSDILAITEHRQGSMEDVSQELITAGRNLAEQLGGSLHLAVIGGEVNQLVTELNHAGVESIYTVSHGDEFNHGVYKQAVEQLHAEVEPEVLIIPHSVNGLDYAPALSVSLDLPLLTDAIGLEYDGRLSVKREMYGSKVQTTLDVAHDRCMVTVRPNTWAPAEETGDPTIRSFDVNIDESALGSRVRGFEEPEKGDVDLSEEDFIISIGRGIEEEENLELIEELCDVSGAAMGASRPLVDNQWLPPNRQVGQSGAKVTPTIYLAIGISGAVQHVAGMKGSETIIAINTDPDAPIFDIADYGVEADLFDVVPELIEELRGE